MPDPADTKNSLPGLGILQALVFASGFCSLAYQVVWTRAYADIVGSTALAMTAVFAGFLIFLALGAWGFGRGRVFEGAALRLYGKIELGISLSGLVISLILVLGSLTIAGWRPASLPAGIVFDVAAIVLLLATPVVLMGATLPVILNASRSLGVPESFVPRLYGWNTLGAAAGTIATGFFLIWKIGLLGTVAMVVAINATVGGIACRLARRAAMAPAPAAPEEPASVLPSRSRNPTSVSLLWPLLAGFSGFTVLAYEILWGRIAKFLLGDRTLAISALLAVFIAALGLGSLLAEPIRRRFSSDGDRGPALVAALLVAGALLHLAVVPLVEPSIGGEGLYGVLFWVPGEFARRLLVVWILIFPPILALGTVFPLIACFVRGISETPGRVVGNLFVVNSIGAAAGAFMAAFVISRWFGTFGGFILLGWILAVVGAVLVWSFPASRRWRAAITAGVVAAVGGSLLMPTQLADLRDDEVLVDLNEDEYGVQVLARTESGRLRVRNNRLNLIYELGHWQTAHAQQMAAYLTVLLAGNPKHVINIGTGYGITAGAFALFPEIETIETIEILPFLVKHQETFGLHNFHYVEDPRVTLVAGDGRRYLAASKHEYDIVSVNVLDPYLPGSASLYTVEFWELARSRMRPGAVYTQLFWGDDVDLLVKGMRQVFPTVLFFPAYGGTAHIVVAFRDEVSPRQVRWHLDRLSPTVEREIRFLTDGDPEAHLGRLLPQAWRIQERLYREASDLDERVHSDLFPVLEYRWAHGNEAVSILDSPLVIE